MTKTIVFVVALQLSSLGAMAGEDYVPWTLRDHYSFKGEQAAFHYDVQSAEWKVDVKGLGTVMSDVQAEIELANGRVVRLSAQTPIKEDRESFSGDMGAGTYFRSHFRTNDGLEIRYSVARFSERPFLTLHVEVTNRGAAPIAIAAIRPAVFPSGSIANLNRNTQVMQLATDRRGPYPVVSEEGRASLVRFVVDSPAVTLGIGVMQSGSMDSYIDLHADGVRWSGNVTCAFDPPLTIGPGESVSSDPVWVSFSMRDPEQVHQYHAWSESTGAARMVGKNGASWKTSLSGWVTVEDGASAEDLYAAASIWRGSGIAHALVPPRWESQPGALVGDDVNYPRDMSEVAVALVELGMSPGISIEPLLVTGGKKAWSRPAGDAAQWLDPSDPKGYAYGLRRLSEIKSWGYDFLVVRQASVPDSVLEALNVTRQEADRLSIEMARQASGAGLVLPAASLVLAADASRWRRAAQATRWYEGYDVIAGPVRLRLDGVESFTSEAVTAMLHFGGPIEIVGVPKRKAKRQVAAIFAEHRARGLRVVSGGGGR